MKTKIIFPLLFLSIGLLAQSIDKKAIFLHHSTGEGVWNAGVANWISDYNTSHNTSYEISEQNYPTHSYGWQNYPYDYWNLWINNACNTNDPCLGDFTSQYKLIIWKHCFPGANINADTGSPSVSSETKSLENYKVQYRALRTLMDSYPNNKFLVWTLAPQHQDHTNAAEAARAKQFVDWVKNDWLTENGKSHPNIFVFDFFSLVAELNANPTEGKQYCLKATYQTWDGHPNSIANAMVAPFFAQKIVDLLGNVSVQNPQTLEEPNVQVFPNPASEYFHLNTKEKIKKLEIISLDGKKVKDFFAPKEKNDVSNIANGYYLLNIYTISGKTKTLKITIHHP